MRLPTAKKATDRRSWKKVKTWGKGPKKVDITTTDGYAGILHGTFCPQKKSSVVGGEKIKKGFAMARSTAK